MPRRPEARSLATRLAAVQDRLSASHRRIADRLLGGGREAAFWGVEELAQRAEVSVATVVRFAQLLDYAGFLELRQDLVAQAKDRGAEDRLLQAPKGAAATLVEVAHRDVANIEQLLGQVSEDLLSTAVAMVNRSRHRVILGHGVSALMAQHLAYVLTQAGLPSIAGSPAEFASQVVNLDSRDLVIAFSVRPYSRETYDAAAYARTLGVPVVAFSDRLESPLAKVARATLPIPGENLLFSHSLAAFAVLAHALATAATAGDRAEVLRRQRDSAKVASAEYVEE